ncbi:MerR family transcriptional regulator [Salipaludibacillus neizhouensis]|uniref:MerR family transcriptional regulator n=1 Tax=Salipaludibacillus neizhouensis TaxID=885475 RepID=A0A3A9KA30_9BACI|nr:MerR family transcriptional regulator [Salipaludibacillus neizhouensis]RKL67620.1 MerR family transcriptional regulator [Salipaludibacillus neizhouensis]
MEDQAGKYNIKAVSKLLGIHPGTLRAWERRYQLIQPVRNDAGHRLYTDEQLKVLKWIINKVDNGFTISQAVELLDKHDYQEVMEEETANYNQIGKLKKDLLSSLLKFNETKSNELLDQAFGVFSTEKVVINILGGILADVGDKWEKKEITTAHEHFVTSFLRTKIGMVFHNLPVNGLLPKVICVCGPEERHEIGLLIFTFFLKRRGYETIYLGSGIPEDDVFLVVNEVEPKMIIISCTMSEYLKNTMQLAENLHNDFSYLSVGVGGHAIKGLYSTDDLKYNSFFVGDSEEEWTKWLKEKL